MQMWVWFTLCIVVKCKYFYHKKCLLSKIIETSLKFLNINACTPFLSYLFLCEVQFCYFTGEWPKLEDIAQKNSKSAQSSKCRFTSSSTTGILKCRQILFVSSRNVQFDIGEIWKRILQEVYDNQWCSICLPVESAQITSGSLDALVSILAKGVSTTLPHNLELQLSIWETNESLKAEIHNICWQLLRKTFFHLDLNVDELGQFHDRETGKLYIKNHILYCNYHT